MVQKPTMALPMLFVICMHVSIDQSLLQAPSTSSELWCTQGSSWTTGIRLRPRLCRLDKLLLIVSILICNGLLHRILRDGLEHQCSNVFQRSAHSRAGFPFSIFQEPETHGAFPIIGDIRMVYLGLPVDHWGFERVLVRKGGVNFEFPTLCRNPSLVEVDSG